MVQTASVSRARSPSGVAASLPAVRAKRASPFRGGSQSPSCCNGRRVETARRNNAFTREARPEGKRGDSQEGRNRRCLPSCAQCGRAGRVPARWERVRPPPCRANTQGWRAEVVAPYGRCGRAGRVPARWERVHPPPGRANTQGWRAEVVEPEETARRGRGPGQLLLGLRPNSPSRALRSGFPPKGRSVDLTGPLRLAAGAAIHLPSKGRQDGWCRWR